MNYFPGALGAWGWPQLPMLSSTQHMLMEDSRPGAACCGTFLPILSAFLSFIFSQCFGSFCAIDMEVMKDESIVVGTDHDPTYLEHNDENDDNIDPSVPTHYRGTAADQKDMKVLGKTQVLRVRPRPYGHGTALTISLAQFQVRRHAGICFNCHGQLGNFASVRTARILGDMALELTQYKFVHIRSDRRRHRSSLLGLDRMHLRDDMCLCFHSRNGIDVAYRRRAVPLGVGICTPRHTEVPELPCWCVYRTPFGTALTYFRLAMHYRLASLSWRHYLYVRQRHSRPHRAQCPGLCLACLSRNPSDDHGYFVLDSIQYRFCVQAPTHRGCGPFPAFLRAVCDHHPTLGPSTALTGTRNTTGFFEQRRLANCWAIVYDRSYNAP